jgi:MATE family multidrug resistance protein
VNEEIASLAYTWVKWQILTIWPITMENAFRRYLASQTIVYPQIIGTIVATVIHVILTYILVYKTDLGFLGAIIVIPITYWIMLVVIVLGYVVHYMYYKRLYQSSM